MGFVTVICYRGRKYHMYKNFKDDYDGNEFTDCGFSPMSKAKSIRWSKTNEKKRIVK